METALKKAKSAQDAAFETEGKTPRVVLWISILIGSTVTRALAITFIPELEIFGGSAPDVWLGPWVTDGILGVLIPFVIMALWRLRGPRIWGGLLIYNALGAFDYLTGLITQWLHPLPASIAPPGLVYGSLLFTLAAQLTVIVLLFRRDAVAHIFGQLDGASPSA
ncbi:MAG: hypothetical protein AAGM22_17440 [Acidobacteriota bacterium]